MHLFFLYAFHTYKWYYFNYIKNLFWVNLCLVLYLKSMHEIFWVHKPHSVPKYIKNKKNKQRLKGIKNESLFSKLRVISAQFKVNFLWILSLPFLKKISYFIFDFQSFLNDQIINEDYSFNNTALNLRFKLNLICFWVIFNLLQFLL